ncbi:hypothetical protein XAC3810_730174 [Xanthomonas citri pv. citri]|nr:hypothetical protein XAC9322_700174 [Xanthomonas citri pv. citri]CEJ47756.1 hypothetical protein XAB3213_3990011 [Xanthomonas citri pv. bilvae]CEE39302.1 hypothetical protein XAC1083_720174 [Xanthomonas citri pv. citri]CEE47004.1 hypothetical protein XAC3810_730174 [Xanthomonas citri pv. citri]CEE76003.1 hypothetical protein XACW160_710151 [Xanthomonas citri pv. citri]
MHARAGAWLKVEGQARKYLAPAGACTHSGFGIQSAQANTCLQTPTSQLDLGYMRQPRTRTPLNTSTGA